MVTSSGRCRHDCHGNTIQPLFPHDSSYSKRISGHRIFSQSYVQRDTNNSTFIVDDAFVSEKVLLTIERKQIKAILKHVKLPFFCSNTFSLQIRAGSGSSTILETRKVLPIKIHMDEETGNILNLVFVWAEDGTELKVDVPVVFTGEDCPGLKKGGQLNMIRTSLKYLCPVEHIPTKFEVDVSNIDIGDKVSMNDVVVHPSLKLLSKNGTIPICKIMLTNTENSEATK